MIYDMEALHPELLGPVMLSKSKNVLLLGRNNNFNKNKSKLITKCW